MINLFPRLLQIVGLRPHGYDGRIGSLIMLYRSHEHSPFQLLRPATRQSYEQTLRRLQRDIGRFRVRDIDGVALAEWHRRWSYDGSKMPVAHTNRKVLLQVIRFGVMMRLNDCNEAANVITAAARRYRRSAPRNVVFTAQQVVALRRAAHQNGSPSRALAYAIMFETMMRSGDVIGHWYDEQWHGLSWEDIDQEMVLRLTPSKTRLTSGVSVTFPLQLAPMVLEELSFLSAIPPRGPVVVNERRDRPFRNTEFNEGYRLDRELAGIPATFHTRDLRASGITEGRASGASIDDAAKVAAHSETKTTAEIYDRANLEAATRFAEARLQLRKVETLSLPKAPENNSPWLK